MSETAGDSASGGKKGTALYLHTLETLCGDLISGRPVIVDERGTEFALASPASRSVLNWYWRNRPKWAQPNRKEDVKAIADTIDSPPPVVPKREPGRTLGKPRKLYLKSLRAHRFGGIHRYGTPEKAPEDFEHEFNRGLTMVEGDNGAGKTSIINAICWCLTGYIYRTQRAPEEANKEVLVTIDDQGQNDGETVAFGMRAVTPVPSANVLRSLGETQTIPQDTKVELVFEDEDGAIAGRISRTLTTTKQGKTLVTEPEVDVLALDPVAREVGIRMPGLIPYIQLGTPCEIGKAIAGLTGIKALEDLVTHADKSRTKLRGEMLTDLHKDIDERDSKFRCLSGELTEFVTVSPGIRLKATLPEPNEVRAEVRLRRVRRSLQLQETRMLSTAQAVLGKSFDYSDQNQREDLIRNVGQAKGRLQLDHLRQLNSARRLARLGELTDEQLLAAEELVSRLAAEAEEISRLSLEPEVATRFRLYARVANWMKTNDSQQGAIIRCPICETDLTGKRDPVTNKSIVEHITEWMQKDAAHLEHTLSQWEDEAVSRLRVRLPEPLSAELVDDLPEDPQSLIHEALATELFESPIFAKSLSPIKTTAHSLCENAMRSLPRFEEPAQTELPSAFRGKADGIAAAIRRATRAVAFARWRKANRQGCKEALQKVVGIDETDGAKQTRGQTDIQGAPLWNQLAELERIVAGVRPLGQALSKIGEVEECLRARRKCEERILLYARAAAAIDELLPIRDLVEQQVTFLMTKLCDRTKAWEQYFYQSPFAQAPQVVGTTLTNDGAVRLAMEIEGTTAGAHHVSNASHLRAALFGFLIAFWEHLWRERSGLALLLFDDLPELFDLSNRQRIASNLYRLVKLGAQVVVTTNDHDFGRNTAKWTQKRLTPDKVDRRYVHPLVEKREHIDLGYFVEDIERKRKAFVDTPNDHACAREYLRYLRIYLEQRLLDLFDVREPVLPDDPCLMDLIAALRTRVNSGMAPFIGQPFRNVVDAPELQQGSDFLVLINKSHHGREDLITYSDVLGINQECVRVRRLIEQAWESWERWLRRDTEEHIVDQSAGVGESLVRLTAPHFHVPLIENLAAFTHETRPVELHETYEFISGEQLLQNRACYLINTHNFGFSASIYSAAIVKLDELAIPDNSLVIACHKDRVYARRLWLDKARPDLVGLGSDAENPIKRPPSLLLPAEEVRLLRVVGIIFGDNRLARRTSDEAIPLDHWAGLEKVELIFKDIRGESAIPFALPGQIILGGPAIGRNELSRHVGCPVALLVEGTGGGAVLKKVGDTVPGAPHLRQFESIGALGESMLIKIEDVGGPFAALPLFTSARKVVGVLYEM